MKIKYNTFSTINTTLTNIQNEMTNLETLKGNINSLQTDISEIAGALSSAKSSIISNIDNVTEPMNSALTKATNAISDLQAYESKAAGSSILNKELKIKTVSSPGSLSGIGTNYTIKSGDTLSEIAKANNATVEELMKANPDITNPNFIFAGASMIIPTSSTDNKATEKEADIKQEIQQEHQKQKKEPSAQNSQQENSFSDKKTLSSMRITSYYPSETSNVTGSGKTTNDFEIMDINGKKVYTYDGKVVVATATEELLRTGKVTKNGGNVRQEGKYYFSYGDEIVLNIDGKQYDAIVLDSCGASMWEGQHRVDIFVPTQKDIIDRTNTEVIVK